METPATLHLAIFSHAETDCPVKQTTPNAAHTLSQSLTVARQAHGKLAGAFLPPDHRGALLAHGEAGDIKALLEQVLAVPPHIVEVFTVPQDEVALVSLVVNPSLLEGSSEAAQANRRALFGAADRLAPAAGYGESLENHTISLSLFELEDFLAGKAAEIAAQ